MEEQAVKTLHEGNFSIVVLKDNETYTSIKRGIAPILELLDNNANLLCEAVVADKVIGKAAALLLIKGKVKFIYADVISEHASKVLKAANVAFQYQQLVPYIINRDKSDMCPMEKRVLEVNDPEDAYDVLHEALEQMKRNNQ